MINIIIAFLCILIILLLIKGFRNQKNSTTDIENKQPKQYTKIDYTNSITTEKDFWELIDFSLKEAKGNKEVQIGVIENILYYKSDQEVLNYGKIYDCLYSKSATEQLWAIIYSLNGGCGDDSFDYYRSWLISEGKEKFYNLLGNPENLVDKYSDANQMIGFLEEFHYLYDEIAETRNNEAYFDQAYENNESFCALVTPQEEFEWEEDLIAVKESFPNFYETFVGDE